MIRKVLEQFKTRNNSSEPSEEMLLLYSFSGDETSGSGTEEWTDSLYRGGLWHISDLTYSLFCIMEELCRSHLSKTALTEGVKLGLAETLHDNEDVLFQWSVLSPEIEEGKSMCLLKAIIKLYTSIRGHAFASSCLELYKQYQRKTLQKKRHYAWSCIKIDAVNLHYHPVAYHEVTCIIPSIYVSHTCYALTHPTHDSSRACALA